jgi:hypothetical protein
MWRPQNQWNDAAPTLADIRRGTTGPTRRLYHIGERTDLAAIIDTLTDTHSYSDHSYHVRADSDSRVVA